MLPLGRAGPRIVAAAVILSVCLLPAGAAPTLDLRALNSFGTVNGAYFEQIDPSSTGTGVISSFVRIQARPTAISPETCSWVRFRLS